MSDPSPAVFIRRETAELVASRMVNQIDGVERTVVVPFSRRGEMQGWQVRLYSKNRNVEVLSNETFERHTGEAA